MISNLLCRSHVTIFSPQSKISNIQTPRIEEKKKKMKRKGVDRHRTARHRRTMYGFSLHNKTICAHSSSWLWFILQFYCFFKDINHFASWQSKSSVYIFTYVQCSLTGKLANVVKEEEELCNILQGKTQTHACRWLHNNTLDVRFYYGILFLTEKTGE